MKLFLTVILFACLLGSCKKEKPATPAPDPGPTVFPLTNESFTVTMSEVVDSTRRHLWLTCAAEPHFGYSAYGILYDYSFTENEIVINFTGAKPCDVCPASTEKSIAIVNLLALSNKNYKIDFNVGQTKVSGQLNVTDGNFSLVLPTQTSVIIVNPELKRIPENTIYGFVRYNFAGDSVYVQNFMDSLQLLGALPKLYLPGDYYAFKIGADGKILQKPEPGYNFNSNFIFNNPNNSKQIKSMVKRFWNKYPNPLYIQLTTTGGEIFRSWVP